MRILFACGGTAGHINPALAVASQIRREHKDWAFLFAGNPNGMEATLVPKAGFDFAPVEIYGFQRSLSPHNIARNLKAAACLAASNGKVKKIISGFKPDLAMGTGGYVSGPVLLKASKMGIKAITHEQNAFPGVTTRLLAGHIDKVLLAVPNAMEYLPKSGKYTVTGNPVRREVLLADREESRAALNVGNRICLLTFGGSLGASRINEAVADVMAHYANKNRRGRLHQIHATGRYGSELFPRLLSERGVDAAGDPHLDIREYIHNMPECLAAADLVLCRAGAISLSELQAAGRASILIPSPNVAENHQYHNAMVLANKNAAIVIEEKNLTGELLLETLEQLISDPQELENLGKNASAMAIADACERICREVYSLLEV